MILMSLVGFVLVRVSDHFTAPGRSNSVLTKSFQSYKVIGQFCIAVGLAGVVGSVALFLLRQI